MKKMLSCILIAAMLLALCSCGGKENPSQTDNTKGTTSSVQNGDSSSTTASTASGTEEALSGKPSYPYVDTEGRTRYQLYINGKLVETQHDPYTYASEPNGAFYPIVEVLSYLGVECLFDESLKTLTTKINGKVITCSAGNKDIKVGQKTLGGTAPEYVEDCFFVPSFTFMELLDAVVDFNSDRSGVTVTTAITIDASSSGVAGLSISAESAVKIGEKVYAGADACSLCGGTGKCFCSRCSGTGSVTQYLQTYDPITKQMTIKSARAICTACGGTGFKTCPYCGGSGKR